MFETINEQLKAGFYNNSRMKDRIMEMENKVLNMEITSLRPRASYSTSLGKA